MTTNHTQLAELIRQQDRLLKLIGHGISLWATMEGNLVLIFMRLMGTTHEKAGLVLYSMPFSRWLIVLTDLFAADLQLKPLRRIWNKKLERLRILNDLRDRLAHHTILESLDGRLQPGKFDTRPKSASQSRSPLSEKEISGFIDKVIEIHNDLAGFYGQIPVQPSAGIPQQPNSDQLNTGSQ